MLEFEIFPTAKALDYFLNIGTGGKTGIAMGPLASSVG